MWLQDALEGLANKIYGIENHSVVNQFSGTRDAAISSGTCYGTYDPLTGLVTLTFNWTDNSAVATSATIYTIPEDYRPSETKYGAGIEGATDANTATRVSVNSSGVIKQAGSSSNSKFGCGVIAYYI